MGKKLFDFCIGNPPYQGENDKNGRQPPVYHEFMDEAYKIADCTELITPARFLFNAGQTPKIWNQKMLNDEHFSILYYEADASKVFPNTDIKGGVAITIRDSKKDYGKISVFTPYNELNSVYNKIIRSKPERMLDSLVSNRGMYRLTNEFYIDFPDAKKKVGAGTGNMIVSNIFDKIPEAFSDEKPLQKSYIRIFGRQRNERVYRYIKKEFIIKNAYIDNYKVFFPEANSSGRFGEILTLPEVGIPGDGATDTFLNIGPFAQKYEADSLVKYIKSKFMRALLGIKKATQHTPRAVWDTIPVQDFTVNSDIDWSKSIHEIDLQLYKKYGLSEDEIAFIEENVKEMV